MIQYLTFQSVAKANISIRQLFPIARRLFRFAAQL